METVGDIKIPKEVVKKLKSGSQVILLRHAESKYNEELASLLKVEHTEEDEVRVKTKRENRDSSLTQLGIKQCEIAAEIAKKLNVQIVLVSPMKRTLQTAYHVFKNHPNYSSIEFIVVPKLKEWLGSVADIPKDTIKVIKHFQEKFPNFNWSLIQDYDDMLHYYLEDIKDEFAKKILREKTSDPEDPWGSNSYDLMVDYIQQCYPRKVESGRSVLKRISKVKKYIHDLLLSRFNSSTSKMLSEDSKIVVVTHKNISSYWTGKWEKPMDEYEEIPYPHKFRNIKNCEFYSDKKNFPVKTKQM